LGFEFEDAGGASRPWFGGKEQAAVTIDNHPAVVSTLKKHAPLPAFTTYVNAKFGFRIDYPKAFVQSSSAENGDSSTFSSQDGKLR
jgi:hypothetical protein